MDRQICNVRLTPLLWFIAVMIAGLIAIHCFVMVCWTLKSCGPFTASVTNYGHLFDLNRELNIPTWASSALIVMVGGACALVGLAERQQGGRAWPWWGLGVVFAYMSMDEAAELHGLLANEKLALPGMTGAGFAWLVPGLILAAMVALAYLRWVLRQPTEVRNLFFVAGTVYVTGALGFEALGGLLADPTYFNPAYLVASTIEETLEFLGMLIMLYAVLRRLDMFGLAFGFTVSRPRQATTTEDAVQQRDFGGATAG
ncbi:hypothetical protein AC244_11615 [Ensifer adhaerens]|uniref:Uncharacterized protein n=1 Tax=Ensifer adhaerens TaxID=106592 RepID=A0A0L8BXW8_ENSAD|nr:hypothetical protein [Ensifer adhaerens]KOF19420.1 hypothetical protein AC244_11615 [Ensifer adhaerens]